MNGIAPACVEGNERIAHLCTAIIALGVGIILLLIRPLVQAMRASHTFSDVLLPVILVVTL